MGAGLREPGAAQLPRKQEGPGSEVRPLLVCPLPCSGHSSLASVVRSGKLRWEMHKANQQNSSLARPGTLSSEVADAVTSETGTFSVRPSAPEVSPQGGMHPCDGARFLRPESQVEAC